jgi:excinuclease ABC subunit C
MREAAAGRAVRGGRRYRNRLFAVRHLAERQAADKRAVGTVDVVGLAKDGRRAAVQVFPLRDGKLIDRYTFHLENVPGRTSRRCWRRSASSTTAPRRASLRDPRPSCGGGHVALAEFLSERRGARVEVRAPQRGEKRRLQELADQNAALALEADVDARGAETPPAGRGARGAP